MNIKDLAENLGLEETEYLELIRLLIDTVVSDLDKLQSAIAQGDAAHAAEIAHSVKGAAGNLGFARLHDIAGELEEKAGQGRLEGTSAYIPSLKKNLQDIIALVG